MNARACCLALLLAALACAPAARATTPETLAEARSQLAAATAALAAARSAPEQTQALVAAVGGSEAALARMRDVILAAAGRDRELALALALRRDEIMRLTAALQGMSRVPPPPPALHPDGPAQAARARAVLARVAPELRDEATELAGVLAEREAARDLRRDGLAELAAGLAALEAARDELADAIPALPAQAADPALAAAVRGSESLTALAAALAGPEAGETPPVAEGSLLWPAAGRLLLGHNAPDGSGARRPGILIGAPARSLVAAPATGRVRYAGPFLEFGYVVVLDTGGGTLVVLAGLAKLNVVTGAEVERGELLGQLGGRALGVEEYVMLPHAETGAGALETIYIEIRHGRGPVDPEPWFGAENG